METKEKNRQRSGQRPSQEERRRKAAPEERKRREERPRRQAEERPAPRRQRPEEKTARQNPEQRKPRQSQQSQQSQQPQQRRQRPAQPSASVQRPVQRDGDIHFAAPQGTGMRKSAPRMSPQETAALRQQQRSRPQLQQSAPKKNALQQMLSGTREPESENAVERAQMRRKARAAKAEKKRRSAQRHDTPAIIYTQPQTFNRDRLLLQLLTVTAVVAALVLAMSVFFKVKTITVAGAETYSNDAVQEASGIHVGDNLLTFSKARASAQIRAKLSYVDNIRIGIKLPDTVIIYIEELDVAYAVESNQGDWWLINSDGKVVEQIDSRKATDHTQVLGVTLDNPQPGSQAVAADFVMQTLPAEGENQPEGATVETAAPAPIAVTGAQRLSSALQILKALEANDIVGEAASVEVGDLEDITLWYGSRYEVRLGDTSRMEYKIACMNDAILQMSDYQSGILDISFTTWTDQVGYTPFG